MRRRTVGVRRGAGAAALAAGLVLGGCGILPGSGGQAPSGPASSAPASSAPTGGASASASSQPSGGAAPSDSPTQGSGPVLGTRTFTVKAAYAPNKIKIRFDLLALQRRGDLLELRADLVNLSEDQSTDQRWQVAGRFNGSYRKDLNSTDGAFSGVVLTDLAQKKRYFVAADSAGACVCTTDLSGTFPDAGDTVELTATYAAPPTSTTTVDVSVPKLGTFRDVAIS